jgi:hypothetical protein
MCKNLSFALSPQGQPPLHCRPSHSDFGDISLVVRPFSCYCMRLVDDKVIETDLLDIEWPGLRLPMFWSWRTESQIGRRYRPGPKDAILIC